MANMTVVEHKQLQVYSFPFEYNYDHLLQTYLLRAAVGYIKLLY